MSCLQKVLRSLFQRREGSLYRRAVRLRCAHVKKSDDRRRVEHEAGWARDVDGVQAEALVDAVRLGDLAVFVQQKREADGMFGEELFRLEHAAALLRRHIEQRAGLRDAIFLRLELSR